MLRVIVILVLPLCCAFAGCAHRHQVTWRLTNPDTMRDTVMSHVPADTSIDEAVAFMESEGFVCKLERDSTFSAVRHWSDDGPKHEHLDFVRCNRTQSAGGLMHRVWNVAIVLDGDKASDVLVSTFEDGP